LGQLLPGEPVLRMDADTTARKGAQYRILKAFHLGQARLLIGTQMIAKGHHFPQVTLVGIVNIDDLLGMPDYRAGERAFQLLAQMAGRAGRGDRPGRVLVQTRMPRHPVLSFVVRHDYRGFAAAELAQRSEGGYPPHGHLALVTVAAPGEKQAEQLAGRALALLQGQRAVLVLGPAPAALHRLRGLYRWQLLLKYQRPSDLDRSGVRTLAQELGARVSVNVEPAGLI
jgi:primosomal protein N' (replication factor Y)